MTQPQPSQPAVVPQRCQKAREAYKSGRIKGWPRLSASLPHARRPDTCQACGLVVSAEDAAALRGYLGRWQEHDDQDQPENIIVVLCAPCGRNIIGSHPRLYRLLDQFEPWTGCMSLCIDCTRRQENNCKHPDARMNGGNGVRLTLPTPTVSLVDFRGEDKAQSGRRVQYGGPVKACAGREVANG